MNTRFYANGKPRDYAAEQAAYDRKWNAVYAAVAIAKQQDVDRICARHELESDEFYTAEQKAARFIS